MHKTLPVYADTQGWMPDHLRIDKIKYGQDRPGFAVNSRKTDRDVNMAELESSIEQEGILQSVLLWHDTEGDNEVWICAGSRRIAGARAVRAKNASRFETYPYILREGGSADDALAWSLATDILSLPPHPVDQFEAFVQLAATATAQEIAIRFGTTELIVKRRLAIGGCAQIVRDAWRSGEIEPGTAMAFTLLVDVDKQTALFKKLKREGALNAWNVRKAIVGEDNAVPRLLALVGREVYESHGGSVMPDLFAEKPGSMDGVSDVPLLHQLADTAINAKSMALQGEGWAWVATASSMPAGWKFSWGQLDPKTRGKGKAKETYFTDEQKEQSGCVISVQDDGTFDIVWAVVKPTPKIKAGDEDERAPRGDDADEGSELSKNMIRTLQRQATDGLAAAMGKQPDLCLAALVAGFSPSNKGPVRVQQHGIARRLAGSAPVEAFVSFESALKVLIGNRPQMMEGVVSVAMASLDLGFDGLNPEPFKSDDFAALANAVKPDALNKALREAFEAQVYFESVPKALGLAAVKEALGAEAHDKVSRYSKGDLVAYATREVARTGWLPAALRAPCYDGPGASAAPKKADKKKSPPKKSGKTKRR